MSGHGPQRNKNVKHISEQRKQHCVILGSAMDLILSDFGEVTTNVHLAIFLHSWLGGFVFSTGPKSPSFTGFIPVFMACFFGELID